MNCPKCGAEITEGMAFCPFCGASLENVIHTQDMQGSYFNGQQENGGTYGNQAYHSPPPNKQSAGTYGNQAYHSPPPINNYNYMPPPKKSKKGWIVGGVIALVLIILLLATLPLLTPYSGVPMPTTGTLKVKYNSVWGNDVVVYLDGSELGQIPSDEYHTFYGISPGTHTVEIRSTGGSHLADKTIEIHAGETTTVELSYLG